jgi:hypothetical protein
MKNDASVLAEIDATFGTVDRPEHFTNYAHCDDVLRGKDRDTLSLHDVGCPASNPMAFASPHGIAYYFPALARLALAQPGDGYYWYASQLMGNLYSGFRYNSFCVYYNAAQRAAVADLICHIIETRAVLIDNHREADEFLRCHELWNDTDPDPASETPHIPT